MADKVAVKEINAYRVQDPSNSEEKLKPLLLVNGNKGPDDWLALESLNIAELESILVSFSDFPDVDPNDIKWEGVSPNTLYTYVPTGQGFFKTKAQAKSVSAPAPDPVPSATVSAAASGSTAAAADKDATAASTAQQEKEVTEAERQEVLANLAALQSFSYAAKTGLLSMDKVVRQTGAEFDDDDSVIDLTPAAPSAVFGRWGCGGALAPAASDPVKGKGRDTEAATPTEAAAGGSLTSKKLVDAKYLFKIPPANDYYYKLPKEASAEDKELAAMGVILKYPIVGTDSADRVFGKSGFFCKANPRRKCSRAGRAVTCRRKGNSKRVCQQRAGHSCGGQANRRRGGLQELRAPLVDEADVDPIGTRNLWKSGVGRNRQRARTHRRLAAINGNEHERETSTSNRSPTERPKRKVRLGKWKWGVLDLRTLPDITPEDLKGGSHVLQLQAINNGVNGQLACPAVTRFTEGYKVAKANAGAYSLEMGKKVYRLTSAQKDELIKGARPIHNAGGLVNHAAEGCGENIVFEPPQKGEGIYLVAVAVTNLKIGMFSKTDYGKNFRDSHPDGEVPVTLPLGVGKDGKLIRAPVMKPAPKTPVQVPPKKRAGRWRRHRQAAAPANVALAALMLAPGPASSLASKKTPPAKKKIIVPESESDEGEQEEEQENDYQATVELPRPRQERKRSRGRKKHAFAPAPASTPPPQHVHSQCCQPPPQQPVGAAHPLQPQVHQSAADVKSPPHSRSCECSQCDLHGSDCHCNRCINRRRKASSVAARVNAHPMHRQCYMCTVNGYNNFDAGNRSSFSSNALSAYLAQAAQQTSNFMGYLANGWW
eukprot:g17244.t1